MSDGERTLVGLDAAVERVVARVDAADTTPPLEEGLTGRRAYALDVVRKRVRLRSAAPVEPYQDGFLKITCVAQKNYLPARENFSEFHPPSL